MTRKLSIGILASTLVLSMGTVPALATPSQDAQTTPSAVATTSPTSPQTMTVPDGEPAIEVTNAPSTPAEPTPAAVPPPTPTSAPKPASDSLPVPSDSDVEKFGAYMGLGAAKARDDQNTGTSTGPTDRSIAKPLALPAGIQGMDVSGWQADAATHTISQVDWAGQWSMGARFAYIKATEGIGFKDGSFSSHWNGASKVGMLRGGYHFALPSDSSGTAQADYFINNGGGWSPDGKTMPPLLDIEYNPYTDSSKSSYRGNICYNLSDAAMVKWIQDFSNRVKARTGRLPMIYTTTDWWIQCTGNSAAFGNQPLHIAAYASSVTSLPRSWNAYSVWQYSDNGPFDGDSNVWNGTLTSLKTFASKTDTPLPVAKTPSIRSAADIVAADTAGSLWDYPATGLGGYGARTKIGSGWIGLRSINVIDWNADGIFDLVAQWDNGRLDMYRGLGAGGFASAQSLGASGWNNFQLTIGYWLSSSRFPQILARSSSGALRLWSNGSGGAIAAGPQIGSGWAKLNLIMIDFDGDNRQDILAQTSTGTMVLYRSDGAGRFISETRRTIGQGWGSATSMSISSGYRTPSDNGILVRFATGKLAYYPVPGNSTFSAPITVGTTWNGFLIAGGETLAPRATIPAPPVVNPSIKAASDIVSVDAAGTLWRHSASGTGLGSRTRIGGGFTRTVSIHAVDWNADGVYDLLTQWKSGELSLYTGSKSGGFNTKTVLASSGWAGFDITSGFWIQGAKYPSIVARRPDGTLASFTSANGTSLSTPTPLGSGFARMHPIMGDFDGDGKADIAAIDNVGQLILYRSNGANALVTEARPVIGVGWTNVRSASPARGYSSTASNGVLALATNGTLSYYPIVKSAFGRPVTLASSWTSTMVSGSSVLVRQRSITSVSDVLTADSRGALWNYPATGTGNLGARFQIGYGWLNVKSLHVLDWNADGIVDVLTQWSGGAMTVYVGSAAGGFSRTIALSTKGWSGINFVTGPWLAGSKYPSLVGTNTAGNLFVWANGSGGGLSNALQIGNGWGTLKLAMIDFDKNGTQDILGVDGSGFMKLYRSTGTGKFVAEPRPTVGNGWSNVDQFSGTAGYAGPSSTGIMTVINGNQPRYYPLVAPLQWGVPRNATTKVAGSVVSR
ncbi:lysozyme [Arthrobacter sp. Sr24]